VTRRWRHAGGLGANTVEGVVGHEAHLVRAHVEQFGGDAVRRLVGLETARRGDRDDAIEQVRWPWTP